MKEPSGFKVKEKRSKLIFNAVLGSISLSLIIVFAVLRIVNVLDNVAFIMMLALAIFLLIAVIGICSYYKNEFIYKDGKFFNKELFHRVKEINVKDLSCVIAAKYHSSYLIMFKDKSGKTVIALTYGDELVRRNLLASVLTYYGVNFYKK